MEITLILLVIFLTNIPEFLASTNKGGGSLFEDTACDGVEGMVVGEAWQQERRGGGGGVVAGEVWWRGRRGGGGGVVAGEAWQWGRRGSRGGMDLGTG